ncbi:Tetratricopeptide repeat-containing protein [Rubritalea squalenifaciens DSM 18772]|uniref:Tetratricopeptide repeat-containing protein n=1 Tax=Rubritalea squalenifaciens DSM 18772 TaxID=1123071 RepID=A0A1M6NQZ7_9BACT|nr:sulfotransferase [Rubritalea squalenifaciens]SHJ97992.1 Tetratricopeptide repeat-containing protein [Rubritalea squalenifaciens DSM 18772]
MNDQKFLEQTVNMARAGEYARAIPRFERLIKSYPDNVPLRLLWAKSLVLNFQFDEAELVLEHILEGTSRDASVMIEVAKCREQVDQYEAALNIWREIAEGGSSYSQKAWVEVSRLSERLNRVEEAQEAIFKAEVSGVSSPQYIYVRSLINERLGNYDEAIEGYLKIAQKAQSLEMRQSALCRLGKIHEAREDVDRAVKVVLEAKSLGCLEAVKMRKTSPVYGPEKFSACVSNPSGGREDHIMMLGFPRSGTTLVSRRLASHCQIQLMDESLVASHVLNKYNAHRGKISAIKSKEASSEYWSCVRRLMRDTCDDVILVDKNPALSLWVPWFTSVFPKAKTLWVDRDPRDIFVSCFFTYFPLNGLTSYFWNADSLVDVIEKAWRHRKYLKDNCDPHLVKFISYEALLENDGKLGADIWKFLGLECPVEDTREKAGKLINSPTYADSIKPIYRTSISRWRKYENHFSKQFERLNRLREEMG